MRRTTTLIVALVMIVSMPALDIALVVMVLPLASQELLAEPYSLILSSYLVALLATTLPWGVLSDRVGPRMPLLFGTALFVLGAVGSTLADGFWLLIVCRVVQGAGAGSMQALTQAAVASQFSAHASRARVLAVLSAAWGGAAVVAPLIISAIPGGQWRLVFLTTVPFGVVSFVILPWAYRAEKVAKRESFDLAGMLLIVAASVCLGVLVTEPELPVLVSMLMLLALVGILLISVEKRADDPILPVELIRHRGFLYALLASVLLGSMLITTNVAAPLYGQIVLGVSPAVSGWVYAALSVAWTLAALAASVIVKRFGIRFVGTAGGLTVCAGYVLLLVLVFQGVGIGWLVFAGFVVGAGLGPLANSVVIMIQEIASKTHVGIASSLNMVTRATGQTVGVALLAAATSLSAVMHQVSAVQAPTDPSTVRLSAIIAFAVAACMAITASSLIFAAKPNSTRREVCDVTLT